jgi:hypothetical protein
MQQLKTIKEENMNKPKTEKDLSWVKNRQGSGYTFFSNPITIHANIETVWNVVKDIPHYKRISNGAVDAHIDGPVEAGTPIHLDLYPDEFRGKFIPQSHETISIVDENQKVIGWEREIPLTEKPTERYQVLEKISEKETRSVIGLRIHGYAGFFTEIFMNNTVVESFTDLNNGIKAESEKRSIQFI